MTSGGKALKRSWKGLWRRLDGSRAHLAKADLARDQLRWGEAVELYTSYLAKRPRVFGAWVQLGHAFKESGRLEEAEQAYSRAAALRADDADLYLSIGHLAKLRGDMPEAIRFYQQSFSLDQHSPARSELVASGLLGDPELHRIGNGWGQSPLSAIAYPQEFAIFPSVIDARLVIVKPFSHVAGAEVALFVTHAPDGAISPHVAPYITSLVASGLEVLLIVAGDQPPVVDHRLDSTCAGIIARQNLGYDFAAWAHAIRMFPEIYDAPLLYLVNDSMFGPNDPQAMAAIVDRIRTSQASVVALTGSREHAWHLQTYFLGLKRTVTASFAFQFFIHQVRSLPSKNAVIAIYEVPLTSRLEAAGFRTEALFPSEGTHNPTMHGWRELMRAGFPLVKTLLFRKRFVDIDVTDADEELGRAGFDVEALGVTLGYSAQHRPSFPDAVPVGTAVRRSVDEQPAQLIRGAGLFDDRFYLAANPDVVGDPLAHYLAVGWKQGRTPNALFDPAWYRRRYTDISEDLDPVLDYVRRGAAENRNPGPRFDTERYRRAQHLPAGASPLGHAIHNLSSVLQFGEQHAEILKGGREHILIVAELSIPQCRKYRVDQKKELLERLGADATVVSWTDARSAQAALASCTSVIFYRVPADAAVLSLIAKAQARGLPTYWEVDDLIFDPNEYILNENLKTLPSSVQLGVLAGVPSYRAAMLACGAGIASTPALATAMREAGLDPVFLVQNALDASTLTTADRICSAPVRPAPSPAPRQVIVYGSGTNTHDNDFRECAAALLQLLTDRPEVTLRIIGDLRLSVAFDQVAAQVEWVPKLPYAEYLNALAQADVSIAPLEPTRFNDCKSNIKFLESAIVGVPCVSSASPSFMQVVVNGETGFIAYDKEDWLAALARLLDDADLRDAIATAARDVVRRLYSPDAIARGEVARLLRAPNLFSARLRVVSVNIFYAPRSFGGATIVAEHMAKLLHARGDVDMLIFTSLPDGIGNPYDCFVYEEEGVPVVGMSLPPTTSVNEDFDNPKTMAPFDAMLRAYRPDVVHFHSIQGLSATMAQVCRNMRIPYVVTAHDAWWICGRQFMVTGEGVYCNQYKIDLNICSSCVNDAGLNVYRTFKLRDHLLAADRVLTPSRFFADLYIANGFPAGKVGVNRNGLGPATTIARQTGEKLRFGFVGGNAQIKGANLLREIFARLDRPDYELLLVDNTTALGFSSVRAEDWPIAGDLIIVPAYTQAELDSFFASIDVLLFPTQWKESFGLTVREALLRNVWVIATDAGGVAEDILPGENGDVISFDDDGTAFEHAVVNAIDRTAQLKRHVNHHKGMIGDLHGQAADLYEVLLKVASEARPTIQATAEGREL